MDFAFSEAQDDLSGLVRTLVDSDRPLWTLLDEAGVLMAALPESVGGGGFGLLEQCSVALELGRAAAQVPYAAFAVAASAIAEFGDDPRVDLGMSCAVTDDPLDPVTFSNGRLNGTKTLVPTGEVFVVTAGADAFVVRADGVSTAVQELVDGTALVVTLTNVTPERILPDAADWVSDRLTVLTCAEAVGVLAEALRLTAAYAGERVQFGRPIGTFQAVTQRLADAYIDVEAVRLTLWQAAWRLSEGLSGATEVATAKFWTADAGHRVAHTAVHVHGGVGIDLDHRLHRYFTAAKRVEFTLGGATDQLRKLGATLAVTP
ncbi:Acyl-CoA dehydrogenase [Actinokineospora alba]|uniref:Acyl-CoA dehydrogenase n=1 Tax=Actinokineospora alba TaxID=504798 RepID=A0A1H0UIA0_9PSEU|nr:acyl-CoA dehydrogenase family protein [Actinokineospora alba]TDP65064.1 alkylation response protein AidB-like acyl-CoA dehydrogenase [Actinokineospora alba]SDH53219.1 Acyl-CoA dehydrogenase [Actinokineospora alba]SDP65894.1 Acyl-CoA dehydrogenase [Actinokineospora alba]